MDSATPPELAAFWPRTMERFGSEERYNREVIADFARADGVELLIVVDKLLVGFDEPRNVVLYVDKSLREHNLLQAIARVNRVREGKTYGHIVDYRGVLGELNEAMQTYNALEGFDAEDVAGTITDVSAEIAHLPQRHSELWAVFNGVDNQRDLEAMQVHLAPEDRRAQFYEAPTAFTRCFKVALGAVVYHEQTPNKLQETYKRDLAFFHNLRQAVRQRYAESIDYRDYESKVRKLLDQHIDSYEVTRVVGAVDIFDAERFQSAVAEMGTPAAQADMIAHQVIQRLTEIMDQDPDRYRRFSRMIQDAIDDYRAGRMCELEYLERVQQHLHDLQTGHDDLVPEKVARYQHAPAYWGAMRETFCPYVDACDGLDVMDLCADAAIKLEEIIDGRKVRDWTHNADVQNEIRLEIEDALYAIKNDCGVPLSGADMDLIIEQVIHVAVHRDPL